MGMVWEELAFGDTVSYTHSREMDYSTAKCYSQDQDSYYCPQGHIPHALTHWANSPPLLRLEIYVYKIKQLENIFA